MDQCTETTRNSDRNVSDRQIFEEVESSLRRGKAVRVRCVSYSALSLALLIAALLYFDLSGDTLTAIMIVASSIAVIWAMMSASASLNAQLDLITLIVRHQSEP